ncbi:MULTISPECIES: nuclease-related domain-containing DEAD/DEAH box helicase [unclassified Adlercreutzia]|uniref:nuclease-related domain-containing DEAD/DEAH box helicase n=1 Tax=unclassified Adlercreutzia TaxID=2636013 RepID=UPI0013EAE507|nr:MULTISPECIES: NERD domain-containing protein/DEAD/DEAH box helicase [unclassified Adlercreutzia]
MARMIPSFGPGEFDERSREGEIYEALARGLDDEYLVIHSLKQSRVKNNKVEESEADFVVFHRKLGILVIEVKAGRVRCDGGEWVYADGRPMKHRGPYYQAEQNKWMLSDRFDEMGLSHLKKRCKFVHAVWFPSLSSCDLDDLRYDMNSCRGLTFSRSDLGDPQRPINRVFSLRVRDEGDIVTRLSDEEVGLILDKVLCPTFNIVPTGMMDYGYSEFVFARLLDSQARVLGFLQDQKIAVIAGAAGTGKTLIAIERAKQAARSGKVLFLCFNALIAEDIKRRCAKVPRIEVRTIASFACRFCDTPVPDYYVLSEMLSDHPERFVYDHVVIDEGQDFGLKDIEEAGFLSYLLDVVRSKDATLYMFYDRRQFVQGTNMPEFINEADCKLTLYVNCRNTESIARCSLRSLREEFVPSEERRTKTGRPPLMRVSTDVSNLESFVDEQIDALVRSGLEDIVVLTCSTIDKSRFDRCFSRKSKTFRWKNTGVKVYTHRQFKGMEAQAVILIDVDERLWLPPETEYGTEPGLAFYTASSRAKHELRIAASMGDDGCIDVLERLGVLARNNPVKRLCKALGAIES